MLLFRSEEHIARWCSDWGQPHSAILPPEQAWQLALAWYSADRRAPTWRRKTAPEAEQVFATLGLTGPFWSLT